MWVFTSTICFRGGFRLILRLRWLVWVKFWLFDCVFVSVWGFRFNVHAMLLGLGGCVFGWVAGCVSFVVAVLWLPHGVVCFLV